MQKNAKCLDNANRVVEAGFTRQPYYVLNRTVHFKAGKAASLKDVLSVGLFN